MKYGGWILRYWKIGFVLGLALITLLVREMVQAYLAEPAARALFGLRLWSLSISQDALWVFFLFIAYVLFVASLFRPLNLQPWQWEEQVVGAERPLKRLVRWIERGDSPYARYRICQAVADMAVRQLAAQLGRSPHQVKSEILKGTLHLPEDVASYVCEGLKMDLDVIESRWSKLPTASGVPSEPRVDPRLIATLAFLEAETNF